MTVPVQRGGSQDDRVTDLILSAIDDLKHGFARLEERVTQRVESLSEQFVPRGEYEARHSDVRNQLTKLDARVDAEIAKIDGRVDAECAERKALDEKLTAQLQAQAELITTQRRYALTTSLTAGLLIIGLLSLILANLR